MSDKFRNKYRIETARLKHWDYGWNAAYFITICTKDRICFFGRAVDDKMVLNDIGLIARNCWLAIPVYFPFVKLADHIVMPNHVHGILVIDKPGDGRTACRDAINRVSTGGITGNKNPMLHDNLSKIIRWYKGRTTFESRKIQCDFVWQPRFHDHIIRNEESFQRISQYIRNNPINWTSDRFNA